MRIILALCLVVSAVCALACSAPHGRTGELIQGTIRVSSAFWLAQIVSNVLAFRWFKVRHVGPGHPVVGIMLTLSNPTWYGNAWTGDCGISMAEGSFVLMALAWGTAAWQYGIAFRPRSSDS